MNKDKLQNHIYQYNFKQTFQKLILSGIKLLLYKIKILFK
jgi:hypothetical protein